MNLHDKNNQIYKKEIVNAYTKIIKTLIKSIKDLNI